jgi:hypothetical protein
VDLKPNKPAFHSVVDLGLRDVGVKNDPRRLAADFGKMVVPLFALVFFSLYAICVVVGWTGADRWMFIVFALALTTGLVFLGVRMMSRSRVVAVKVTAGGANQATLLLLAPLPLVALTAVLTGDPLLIPIIALTGLMALSVWRGRGRAPQVLSTFRPHLAADEPVLGDGVGLLPGARGWDAAFRLVVATDRRLLVAGSPRSTAPFLLVDVPYERVSAFGIEWKYRGRIGVLSLTVEGVDDAPPETHVVTAIAPANLVSIALALQSHGVQADDPAAVSEAERGWQEALHRGESRERLLDRAAVNTREFDRGLWLLLGLAAFTFYLNPFGIGFGAARDEELAVLAGVPALCAICGYVSGTKSSLVYVAPLNLLACPVFFFEDARYAIAVLFVMSAVAAVGLWAGSALRGMRAGAVEAPAAIPPGRAARGSLRYTVSGPGLIRITGMMLAGMVALVASASAAGFELTSLRLAIDEATLRQVPVDGRSNLTGNATALTYTPGPDLHEFITDEPADDGPNDGARWELRSSFTKGYNALTLAHYVREPRLDDPAAVADFVAEKDREHNRLAGYRVSHTERVVDGRKGYVWEHSSGRGYWYYAAWFPQPVHSVRVECVARKQTARFKRLCAEAMGSLKFR